MSALGVALRLARRGATLTALHATLILLIIALPVGGVTAFALRLQSQVPTTAETLADELGRTDTVLRPQQAPDPTLRQYGIDDGDWNQAVDETGAPLHQDPSGALVDPRTVVPSGTRVLPIADSSAEVRTATGTATLPVTLGASADPAFAGRFDLVAGHRPVAPDQITVTAPALARLGIAVGGEVTLTQPAPAVYTVVGVLADHRWPASRAALYLPDGAFAGTSGEPPLSGYSFYLPDVDVDWAQSAVYNHAGISVLSRALVADFGPPSNQFTGNGPLYAGYFAVVGALLAFVIALLAGSAFSIGARARQRVLAVIAATGAGRRFLITLMGASGALVGAVGGAAGIGLGIAGGSVWMALTDDGTIAHYAGYHLVWWQMLAILAYAVFVGWLAAVLPAISASRVDTVAALRGATRPAAESPRRPVVGLVLIIVGVAGSIVAGAGGAAFSQRTRGGFVSYTSGDWVAAHTGLIAQAIGYAEAAAIILTQLGLILCAGAVMRVTSRMLQHLGLASRLATRDLARNRSRTVPAIAAIMAAAFLAVFAATLLASTGATQTATYPYTVEPGQEYVSLQDPNRHDSLPAAAVLDTVRQTAAVESARVLNGAPAPIMAGPGVSTDSGQYPAVQPVPELLCPAGRDGQSPVSALSADWRCRDEYANRIGFNAAVPRLVVGDAADLALIVGHIPDPAAIASLAAGGAVSLHRQYVDNGVMRIDWLGATDYEGFTAQDHQPVASRTAGIDAVWQPTDHPIGFDAVISPAAAARLGITAAPAIVLAQLRHAPTPAQQDAASAALQRIAHGADTFGASYETGPTAGDTVITMWAVLGGSAGMAVCAAVIALALARSDGRRDVAVLAAVGAAPGIRRRYAAWQAAVIVGVGMLLGAITGTIAAFAVEGTQPQQLFVLPWSAIAVAVVGTTVLISLGAWATGSRLHAGTARAAIA